MLRINLLPEHEVKRRREVVAAPAHRISPVTILIIVAYTALIGSYYYFGVRSPLVKLRQEERTLSGKVEELDKGIKTYQSDSEKLGQIQYFAKLMSDIIDVLDPPDRLFWSKKLNQISDLRPDSVYVSQIKLTEEVLQEGKEPPKAPKAGAEKEGAATTQPFQLLFPPTVQKLEIRAVTDTENASEVFRLQREFHDNLRTGVNKQHNVATDFFESFDRIEPGNVTRPDVGGRNVYEFVFTLTTKPLIAKTTATTTPLTTEKRVSAPGAGAKPSEKAEPTSRKRAEPID